jgi:hypothetical protein
MGGGHLPIISYYPGWSISLDNGIHHVDPRMTVKDLTIVEAGRFPATQPKIKDPKISRIYSNFLLAFSSKSSSLPVYFYQIFVYS